MERLTRKSDDITYLCNYLNRHSNFDGDKFKAVHEKLAEYEELGMTPSEINSFLKDFGIPLAMGLRELKKQLEEYKRLRNDGQEEMELWTMDRYLFTPQKAIEKLKQLLPNDKQIAKGRGNAKELTLAIQVATRALEKEIPKEVTRDSMYSPALCPDCHSDEICKDLGDGYYLYFRDIKYCPKCGQLLDWGNE